jgi:serine/threonine protein kinase
MSGDLNRQPKLLEAILRPGQVVGGQYRVDKLVAEGGMAAVWAGLNLRTGKRVALKAILASMATNREAAELFRSEALAASKVNHPNVVSVFDVIDHASMTCIVMELLEGETLDFCLARKGPLSLQETVAFLLPAMRGVAAAHAQGVVHRDLKPGNIFLCTDADGTVLTSKVLDFGIATMMGRARRVSTALDLVARMGTPAYMSPEAIQCSPDVDGRTDIYGFGVIIFEALTGAPPFPGEPSIELFAQIVDDPPPKLAAYRPDLPPEVALVVNRALAKHPGDRFPDVEHLVRAVEDLLLPSSTESKYMAAIPSVGELIKKESSGSIHQGKTQFLFSLAGSSRLGVETANFALRRSLKHPRLVHTINRARRWVMCCSRMVGHLRRRTAISAGFAVLLAATAYWAVTARPEGHGMNEKELSNSVPPAQVSVPQITRLPSVPPPARSSTSSSVGDATILPAVQTSQFVSKRLLRPSVPRRTTAPTTSVHAPRAGSLSAADF